MLHQQINDLAITCRNWLWNKGCNILSVCSMLLNILSCSLLLHYGRALHAPCLPPSSNSPLPPLPSCKRFPGGPPCSFFPSIFRAGLRPSRSHSIIPMFIQLSALSNRPSTSVLHLRPPLPSSLRLSVAYQSPASFPFSVSCIIALFHPLSASECFLS